MCTSSDGDCENAHRWYSQHNVGFRWILVFFTYPKILLLMDLKVLICKCKPLHSSNNWSDFQPWSHPLLTPWNWVLLVKLTISQLVKKFSAIYGTWSFITAFICFRYLSLSWASSIQSMPPLFHCLGHNKVFVWVWGFLYEHFLTWYFLRWRVVSTLPKPQAGDPPCVGCPCLLMQYIHSYPPPWRPSLHLQPEDVPCRGGRDPLITGDPILSFCKLCTMFTLSSHFYYWR
jgi:hypothetical protein